MKKAVVTGALGFIGSNLVDQLVKRGHSVLGVDNLSCGFEEYKNPGAEYEIENAQDFERYGDFDWVFHLAAWPRIQPSFDDPIGHDDVNVRVTLQILDKLKGLKNKPKLLFTSSSSVYGNTEVLPTAETAAVDPLSPYALQKYTSEKYIEMIGDRFDIPWVSLRFFNAYGPRSYNPGNKWNAYSSVVGIFMRQAMDGKPLTVTGDGKQRRDFVHVLDIADALITTAEKGQGLYNVGTGSALSILDLANEFQKQFNTDIVHIAERKGEALETLADVTKISSLGWKPSWTVERAIREKAV